MDITHVLDRRKDLADARRQWDVHWQELAEIMHPRRADFTRDTVPGEKRVNKIYDGTPIQARRELSSALAGLLMPKGERWFSIRLTGEDAEDLAAHHDVKEWIRATEDRMIAAIYNPHANFVLAQSETDDDLVTFGTGAMFVAENRARDRLAFRALHPKSTLIALDAEGSVDTIFINEKLTARQAVQRFGRDNIGERTREALDASGGVGSKGPTARGQEKTFEFVQAIFPRVERRAGSPLAADMPFANVVVDVDSEHVIEEGGFEEFPCAVPRWDTASGEVYGRSPGMIALPDASTLNQMAKTILRAGHKAADPPLLVANDSVIGGVRTQPGKPTMFDAEVARQLGGRPPITPLQTGFNLPLGREMQADVRELVWAAFFRNVLRLPVAGPQMTATEVIQRRREFIQTLGPTFNRLEPAYPAVIVNRVYGIMARAGALPTAPELIQNRDVRFQYASPIGKIVAQIDALNVSQWFGDLGPLANVDPGVLDAVDTDRAAKFFAEARNVPPDLLRSAEEIDARRQERARSVEAEQTAQGIERAADVAQQLGLQAGDG